MEIASLQLSEILFMVFVAALFIFIQCLAIDKIRSVLFALLKVRKGLGEIEEVITREAEFA